jgi:hypothetical protein
MRVQLVGPISDAWLAGIYEGEGSCVRHRNGEKRFQVHISISSTDEDVVRRFHELAGCGLVFGPYEVSRGTKPQWRWNVSRARDVLAFIERIEPYLLSRRSKCITEARLELREHWAAKEAA